VSDHLSPILSSHATFCVQVVKLHNFLALAANNEARHIACHEDLWRTVYNRGTGERFVPAVPTLPKFEELPVSEADPQRMGEYEILLNTLAQDQDQHEIDEFRRNLAWDLGEVGISLSIVIIIVIAIILLLRFLAMSFALPVAQALRSPLMLCSCTFTSAQMSSDASAI
jgi:hypothetical protein